MKLQEALKQMKKAQKNGDIEDAHYEADDILQEVEAFRE